MISFAMVETWFTTLCSYLRNEVEGWEAMMKDPRRVFNADESGFPLCAMSGRVLAQKGAKHVYQIVSSKTQITVMACFNANGGLYASVNCLPWAAVSGHRNFRLSRSIYGHSDKGWDGHGTFIQFLHEFVLFVESKSVVFPVILFVDGHSTHISLEAATFCRENKVVLYCLLPNATHILQACDIGLFSPMKTAWQAQLKDWHMANIGSIVTKSIFPGLFKGAWYKVTTAHNASQDSNARVYFR